MSQLGEIVAYIRKKSPASAERVRTRLVEGPKVLQRLPEFGSRVPEFESDHIREILVKPFRVIYVLREDVAMSPESTAELETSARH